MVSNEWARGKLQLRHVHVASSRHAYSDDRLIQHIVTIQICQKSRRIGCVIPHCKLQHWIAQPILRLIWHICTYEFTYFPNVLKSTGRHCTRAWMGRGDENSTMMMMMIPFPTQWEDGLRIRDKCRKQWGENIQRWPKRNANFVKQQLPGLACCC